MRVVATIRVRSQADGDAAKAVLFLPPFQLSTALGVSVLSVEPVNLVDAASAAQSAPSDVGSAPGTAPVIYIGIASGVAGCLLCLCIAVAIERSRRKRTGTVASVTTASSMAVAMPLDVVSASLASATAEPAVEMRQRLPEQVSPLPAAVDLVTQAPPKGQQTPTGARFDPNTGRPIPKFDPQTGVQNW